MSVSHVLVSFDGSRRAREALADGVDTAHSAAARLTVLALAPVESPSRCCNLQTTFWNQEMRRQARDAISEARLLVDPAIDAQFVTREGSGRRAVAAGASELGCDLIIEPARRRPRRSRTDQVSSAVRIPASRFTTPLSSRRAAS